jgi:hypothetical protein
MPQELKIRACLNCYGKALKLIAVFAWSIAYGIDASSDSLLSVEAIT